MPTRNEILLTLAGHLRSSAALVEQLTALEGTPAPVEPAPVDPAPVDPIPVDPAPVEPEAPAVDTSRPIWQQGLTAPRYSAPSTLEVPAGQNVVWIPVTVEHTNLGTVLVTTNRAINHSPATINVGSNQRGFLTPEVFRWSLGDDLTHYIRLQFPDASYRDGRGVRIQLRGVGTSNEWVNVNVYFRDGAQHPDMPAQFHRAPRRLDLTDAVQKGNWNRDPATWEWSDSGFKDGKRVLRSRLSHGYEQTGNQETGLYMNAERFPDQAQNPHSYDAEERAVRLATAVAPDGEWFAIEDNNGRRQYKHQASVLQGQTVDDLCGSDGVWRMVAKMPTKRFSWPAFWLVGRGSQGRAGSWTGWPPEVDIVEIFNQVYNNDPINGYRLHWTQHYGPSGTRVGAFGGHFDADKLLGTDVRYDEGYHSYAAAIVYTGNDAEVTFFFDEMELGSYKLFARNPDMVTRDELFPIMNIAVRANRSWTAEQWNADPNPGDMLVRDVAYFPTGARMVAQ